MSIVNILNTQGQNILLNIFGGPIVNAARGIAVQVTHALYSFISSFQTSVNPQIVKSYASKDFIYFQDLIFVSSKISFFLFLLLVVPVFTEMEQILYLWLNVVPEHTVVFCRYVLLTGLLTTFSSPIITAASSSGNIRKFQLIVNSVFLLNIPISYTFLKLGYNSDSVFQVALFMEAIALICRLLVVKTLVPFNVQKYFKHVLFKALVVFCIVMIPVYIIHSYFLPTIHRLFFTIIFSGLYCAIIIFFIGLTLGVIFVNNANETQANQISGYINNFINSIKENYQISTKELLKNSIINNAGIAVLLWFLGSTVIGFPLIYVFVGYKGYCIGYTVSSVMATVGTGKGIIFIIATMLIQNIIYIPTILTLSVSGIKLYRLIMEDRRRENIKLQILKHTIFSILMLILLLISSLLETYISGNLSGIFLKYC